MTIDRDRLVRIFDEIGQKLTAPATICVIGSTPGIILGQPGRQSQDIDVWRPRSQYDETQFRLACQELGLLYGKRGKTGGAGMILRFTGGRESDSLWGWRRPQTSMV